MRRVLAVLANGAGHSQGQGLPDANSSVHARSYEAGTGPERARRGTKGTYRQANEPSVLASCICLQPSLARRRQPKQAPSAAPRVRPLAGLPDLPRYLWRMCARSGDGESAAKQQLSSYEAGTRLERGWNEATCR